MFNIPFRKAPADLELKVRHIDVDLRSALAKNRYWCQQDAVTSHFFNALQTVFPLGERFFLDAVRDAMPLVEQESLNEDFKRDINST